MQNKNKVVKKTKKNWDADRHTSILVQRNVLFILCVVSLICVGTAMLVVKSMIEKNSIEPYIVAVNDIDKMPVTISSRSVKEYALANTAIIEFFLMKYVNAREGYNSGSWEYNYKTLVPAFSTPEIYRPFRSNAIDNDQTALNRKYGAGTSVDVVIKQITTTAKGNVTTLRIAKKVYQSSYGANTATVTNYQLTIHYIFDTDHLTVNDITINPLGLKIDSYDLLEEKTFVDDGIQNYKT